MDKKTRESTRRILAQLSDGNRAAAAELLPYVYDELRALARRIFRDQPRNHTLEPTALVHEAYLRLVDHSSCDWKSRAHFFSVAAKAMRQVLIDHFRRRRTSKRGGGWKKVPLGAVGERGPREVEFLALDDALEKLSSLDERQAKVVELRFFGEMTVEEVAHVLGVSESTVEGDWRIARAWLARELGSFERSPDSPS